MDEIPTGTVETRTPATGWFERAAVVTAKLLGLTLEPRAVRVIRDIYSNMVVLVVFLATVHVSHQVLNFFQPDDPEYFGLRLTVIVKYIDISLYIALVGFGSLKGFIEYFLGKKVEGK